jgi:uncharacterized membrane protein
MTSTEREVISSSRDSWVPPRQIQSHRENVGDVERWISSISGGALATLGFMRGSWPGAALAATGGYLIYRGVAGYCHTYDLLRISTADETHGRIEVEQAMTINKPAAELYEFWRNFENLPQFMNHLESVETLDERRSHWVAKAPAGSTVAWDAEIIEERPNELIAWRSLPNAEIENEGMVRFEEQPADRGTVVRVKLSYDPPAGIAGALVARLFGEEPRQQVMEDLRRFKRLMETGEIPTTEGQPQGRRSMLGKVLSPNS